VGIEQKAAHNILNKIRALMWENVKMSGVVRIDETWVNHRNTTILVLVEKRGKVKLVYIPRRMKKYIMPVIYGTVSAGSRIETDEHSLYTVLKKFYDHDSVCHKDKQWAKYENGRVTTTNPVEGLHGLFKSEIKGVNRHVSKKHAQLYCNEFAFKFNRRENRERVFFDLIELMMDGNPASTGLYKAFQQGHFQNVRHTPQESKLILASPKRECRPQTAEPTSDISSASWLAQ
jgi:hypothetical protein